MADLKALFLNCTLKYRPEPSHTEALIGKIAELYHEEGVETETVRVTDYDIRFGIAHDMGEGDEWPELFEKVRGCDILVLGTPIWMGVRSSVCQLVIERLDSVYTMGDDETGQYPLYNKVGAVVVTGNEDGAHAAAETTLFNLSHFGCTIPPNADCYWVGDAGPGRSYMDCNAERSMYVNRTARMLVQNTVQTARRLKKDPLTTDLLHINCEAQEASDTDFQIAYADPDG